MCSVIISTTAVKIFTFTNSMNYCIGNSQDFILNSEFVHLNVFMHIFTLCHRSSLCQFNTINLKILKIIGYCVPI